MSVHADIAAVILAAGRSSRMGAQKPLLTLGGETVLERVVRVYRQAGVPDIRVVIGHGAAPLIPVLERMAVRRVVNEDWGRGMFSSVQAGVKRLGAVHRAFFLHPADVPLVRPDTLQTLIAAFRKGQGDVCRPTYRGRRGHPPLIAASLVPRILAYAGPGGLRALFSLHPAGSLDVACDDPAILMDLNTPEDYEAAKTALAGKPPPFQDPPSGRTTGGVLDSVIDRPSSFPYDPPS